MPPKTLIMLVVRCSLLAACGRAPTRPLGELQSRPPDDTSAPESAGDELVRRRVQEVGSHLRVRRCFTQAEIERQQRESQALLRDVASRGNVPQDQN
jgi:hypothetical protein